MEQVCFQMRDKGPCDNGKACIYSHDTAKVKAAKTALETKGGKEGRPQGATRAAARARTKCQ
eukprot:14261262-Heterocapsa_arctica.AAC.1